MFSDNSHSTVLFKVNLGLVVITIKALSIFPKNGKLMTSIASSILLLNSLLYLFNVISFRPFIKHLVVNRLTAPTNPAFLLTSFVSTIKQDLGFLIVVEWIFLFLLLISITSLVLFVTTTTTILASAITHRGEHITFRILLSEAVKTWKRPLCTWFYTSLLCLGYKFIVLAMFYPALLLVENRTLLSAITFAVFAVASIFHAYLAVVWTLSLVVSVLEDVSGIEALGKAAQIGIEDMKLHGFVQNVLFATAGGVLLQGLRLIRRTGSFPVQMMIGLLVLNSISLLRMFLLMAYTVLYIEYKKDHGEEVELQWNRAHDYAKIPAPPPVDEIIP